MGFDDWDDNYTEELEKKKAKKKKKQCGVVIVNTIM